MPITHISLYRNRFELLIMLMMASLRLAANVCHSNGGSYWCGKIRARV